MHELNVRVATGREAKSCADKSNTTKANVHMNDGPPMETLAVHKVQVWPAPQVILLPVDASRVHEIRLAPSGKGLRWGKTAR